jgi:hypothetical protein
MQRLFFLFLFISSFTQAQIVPQGFLVGKVKLAIGDAYQGGKIAYIFASGDPGYVSGQTHGLIATVADVSSGAQWGCYGSTVSGADGEAIGTGNQNTIEINMAGCSSGSAASLCANLVQGGYSDWYLPSLEELRIMRLNKSAIGGFAAADYWSSSEYNASNAYYVGFQFTGYDGRYKYSTYRVRAVRSF